MVQNKYKWCCKRKMQNCKSQVPRFTKSHCWVEWVEKYLAGRETSPKLPNYNHSPQFYWIFQFRGCFCSGQSFLFKTCVYKKIKHTTIFCCVFVFYVFLFGCFVLLPFCSLLRNQDPTYSMNQNEPYTEYRMKQPEAALPHKWQVQSINIQPQSLLKWVDFIFDEKSHYLDITQTVAEDNKYIIWIEIVRRTPGMEVLSGSY